MSKRASTTPPAHIKTRKQAKNDQNQLPTNQEDEEPEDQQQAQSTTPPGNPSSQTSGTTTHAETTQPERTSDVEQLMAAILPRLDESIESMARHTKNYVDDLFNTNMAAIQEKLDTTLDKIPQLMASTTSEPSHHSQDVIPRRNYIRDIRTAAANSRQKIRPGTTTIDPIKAKLEEHPRALVGAMILAAPQFTEEYWLQVVSYHTENQSYMLTESRANGPRITFTFQELSSAAVADYIHLAEISNLHHVPLPNQMVGIQMRYDHADMCVFLELLTLGSGQVQQSFRLNNSDSKASDEDTDRPKGSNRKVTFGDNAWALMQAPRAAVRAFRGKDLPHIMQLPRFAEGDGEYDDARGGAGRYTAMTQDIGDVLATTFGVKDIMYLRTVTEAEAKEAAETKTAPELEEQDQWQIASTAIDAYLNWYDAVNLVGDFKPTLNNRLKALAFEMTNFMRSREASEPGLATRQFPRRFFNAMIRRFSTLMSNPTTKDIDLDKLIQNDMKIVHTSPFYTMAVIGMKTQFEADVAALIKQEHKQSSSGKKTKPIITPKPTGGGGSKPNRDKPTKSTREKGGTATTKTPCYLTYTKTGCSKTDCSFDHGGRELTDQEKGRLRKFIATRNKGKAEDDMLEVRETVI